MVLLFHPTMNLGKDSDQLVWVTCPLPWPVVGGHITDCPPQSHGSASQGRVQNRTNEIAHLSGNGLQVQILLPITKRHWGVKSTTVLVGLAPLVLHVYQCGGVLFTSQNC